jgi:hypothetical protein
MSADFDGDHKPDLVRGRHIGLAYTVEIQFSSRLHSAYLSVPYAGPDALLTICDVNRDSDADLVIQSPSSPIPVAVWLGDGQGHFRAGDPWRFNSLCMSVPSALSQQAGRDQQIGETHERRFSFEALADVILSTDADARGRLASSSPKQLILHNRTFALCLRSPPYPA